MKNPTTTFSATERLFCIAVLFMSVLSAAAEPTVEKNFFNGKDLSGWTGDTMSYWSVKDGVITGHSDKNLPHNTFLWSDIEVADFHLVLDVKMPVDARNAGIQFRSSKLPPHEALGYQADAGKNVWGRLYHERGRGKLDWRGAGEKAIKPGEWNRYEILAVGDNVWTAINGTLSVAVKDPGGERKGLIALQIHSGQAQTVHYRIEKLVHNPTVTLAGLDEAELKSTAMLLERKPNVIVIFTDDQGYGDLGCFGSTTIKTPHIDRMAKEGRKFTNFVVPTSLCTPSRASLLTGSYANRVGMHQWVLLPQSNKGLHPNEHTIADQLRGNGYSTACFGKWHLGHHREVLPHRNGFQTWFGIPYSNDMNHPDNQGKPPMGVAGLDEQWKDPESTLTQWKTPLMENDKIIELPVDQRTITRRYTDKTIDFIKSNKSKPFFIYLPHSMPHVPVYVPDEFYDPDPKLAYIRTMEHIDAEVGRVLDTLRETGLDQHTVVVFTSDNGPAIGNLHHGGSTGGLRGGKTRTFEGGIRVPCVVWGPGRIPAGTSSDQLWSTIDILPTIAGLTKTSLPPKNKIDGLDASALLTDADAKTPRRELLLFDGFGKIEGLRQDPWKLIVKKQQTMLFDLSKDVREQNNLAAEQPEKVKAMTARMNELGTELENNSRPAWIKEDPWTGPQETVEETAFFNGKDLAGWQGVAGIWSVKDGAIVGAGKDLPGEKKFLWSKVEVKDFHLVCDVRLTPDSGGNAGIQFRSKQKAKDNLLAVGYQLDVGKDCWGRIWHENGRGAIDWNDRGEKAIKPGEWNRLEVLAVGDRIWTAVNGTLAVAKQDPEGESRGRIALQLCGADQTVAYRPVKLVHNPPVALAGLTERQLINAADNIPEAGAELKFDQEDTLGLSEGKVALVPSEIGGKALSLNGNARSLYAPNAAWQVGKGPFSLSVWIKPASLRQAGILCNGGYQFRHGWLLDMHPNGSVRLETAAPGNRDNGSVRTPPVLKVGEWTHVAVTVKPDRSTRIFINGQIKKKGTIKGANLTNPEALLVVGGIENAKSRSFHGEIDQAQVFAKALSQGEIAKLSNRASVKSSSVRRFSPADATTDATLPVPPLAADAFALESGEVVVFMGQTDMARSRLDGSLEALLAKRFAAQQPRFRNMAWESDTVYEQWRDIDFGSWRDQLDGAGATMVIAQFGQIELVEDGSVERLPDFIAAYEKLLDQVADRTRRLVLVSPRPFEKPRSPHMPDHSGKNAVVAQYRDAIRDLATGRQAVFVDLFAAFEQGRRLTTNGIHINDQQQPLVARQIAAALGLPSTEPGSPLVTAVREKNRLWYDNWRPMNWSFSFGDRTKQMFGKAFRGGQPLKSELEAFKPLIEKADRRVHDLASGKPAAAIVFEATKPAAPPTGDHSVAAQLDSFKVLDGYQLNLFASEADGVVKPVFMRWDDRGRLWVICIPTYPHIEPGLRPGDYILVCEDTDGDGKADRFERFAEGLFIPMGLEFGDGGVYLTEATELVHLKDTDGDGKADQRTVILSGFGTADSHQMISHIERGPLGDFWFTQGHHAFSRVETPWGISKLEKSGVWRYRPGTGRLDGFFNKSSSGLNGQGVTYEDGEFWGQIFHNSAAGSGGFYTTPGAIATSHARRLRSLTPAPSRNTGIEFLGTKHLPDDSLGDIVWGGFMSNSVELRRMRDDGSGFRLEKLPDLLRSSRRDFRPVGVRVGPDGAFYICDWYNATIGHYQASYRDPARDRTHGRIWRVSAKDRPLVARESFDGLGAEALLERLRSPERLTRTNARKRLFDLPTDQVIPAVERWMANLQQPRDARLLLDACGIVAAHEVVRPELIDTLIEHPTPSVRAIGARLIGRWADRLEQPLDQLARTVVDEHPRVRMESVVAASAIPSPRSMEVAALVLDHPRDRFLDHAFALSVHALRPHWFPALQSGELTFGGRAGHIQAVLEEDGSDDMLSVARKLAENGDAGSLALLARVGTPQDLATVVERGQEKPPALQALLERARLHRTKPAGDMAAALRTMLERNDPATLPLAISLAGAWQEKALIPNIRRIIDKADRPEAVQLASIASLAALDPSNSKQLFGRFAAAGQPAAVQLEAIRALTAVDPADGAKRTYDLLPELDDAKTAAPLVAALIQGPGRGAELAKLVRSQKPDAHTLTRLQQALGLTGQTCPPLQEALQAAQPMKTQPPAQYDEGYVRNLKSLVETKGDFNRGKLAYLKAATCVGCHKIDGVGGNIGPDLSEVGSGRSLEILIESVVWPNRQIREGYMTTKITTKDKQLHVGYPIAEKDGVLTLRDIATANTKKIARADIVSKEEAGSSMIAGLTVMLSPEELADLIAYLAGLKKK